MGTLRNLVITSAGDVGEKPAQLKQWVDANGGRWAPHVQKGVTHMICSKGVYKARGDAVTRAAKLGIHIVSYDWLEDSLQRGRKLSEKKYLWESLRNGAKLERRRKQLAKKADTLKFRQGCQNARENTGSGACISQSDSASESEHVPTRSGRRGFLRSSLEELQKRRLDREKNSGSASGQRIEEQVVLEHAEDATGEMNMHIDNPKEQACIISESGIESEKGNATQGATPEQSSSRDIRARTAPPDKLELVAGSAQSDMTLEAIVRSTNLTTSKPAKGSNSSKARSLPGTEGTPQKPPVSRPKASSQTKTGLPSFIPSTANPVQSACHTESYAANPSSSSALQSPSSPTPQLSSQPEASKAYELTDNHHLYLDNTGYNYEIKLSRRNLYQNRFAIYTLQMFESNTKPHSYCVFARYKPAQPAEGNSEITLNRSGVPIFKGMTAGHANNAQQQQIRRKVKSNGTSDTVSQHPALLAAKAFVDSARPVASSTQPYKALIVPLNSPFETAFLGFRTAFKTLTHLAWTERLSPESRALQLNRGRHFNLEPFLYSKPKIGLPFGLMPSNNEDVEHAQWDRFENKFELPGMEMPLSREYTIGKMHFEKMEEQRRMKEMEDDRVRRETESKRLKNKGKKTGGTAGGRVGNGDGKAVFYGPGKKGKSWEDLRRMGGRW